MSYFPAFLKMDERKVLLVGGGKIAQEKLEKLLQFTSMIKVIATEISPSMQTIIDQYALDFETRAFQSVDLEGIDIVIVAVDDLALQEAIYRQTRGTSVLCNAVDNTDYCDFIFGSFIKEGDLTIAISTSGASPAFAKHFRRYLQRILPKNIDTFLKEMRKLRTTLPKGKERMELLEKKAQEFIRKIKP